MAGDSSLASEDVNPESAGSSNGARVPRVDLHNAIEVLEGAYQHGRSPSITQIAAALDQRLSSGAFRSRMAAASHFGLISPERGRVRVTDVGMRVLDPEQRPAALVEAWMNVPVFKSLFDRFDGSPLPPESGVEAELQNLGVPTKNVALARRVLMKSADTAGLLNSARDRLVQPTYHKPPQHRQSVGEDHFKPRKPRSPDVKPIELDFGDAGQVEVIVDINWLALKPEVFGELRPAVEKLESLAAMQRRPHIDSQSDAGLPRTDEMDEPEA